MTVIVSREMQVEEERGSREGEVRLEEVLKSQNLRSRVVLNSVKALCFLEKIVNLLTLAQLVVLEVGVLMEQKWC